MSIYRGIGGSVDATTDAIVEEVTAAAVTAIAKAAEASTSASNASTSASNALSSENTATTKASEASTAASQAAASASTASTASVASIAARDAAQIYRDEAESFTPDGYEARLVSLEQGDQLINDLSQAYEFATLDEAVNSTIVFPVGKVIHLKERSTGNGGGGIWDVVSTSSVTPNNYDIVQSIGQPVFSFVLRVALIVSADQLGLKGDKTDELQGLIRLHNLAIENKASVLLGFRKNYGMLSTAQNLGILINESLEVNLNESTITSLNDGNGVGGITLHIYKVIKGGIVAPTFKIINGILRAPLNYDEIAEPFPLFNDLKDSATGYTWNTGVQYACGDVNLIVESMNFMGYWGGCTLGSGGNTGNVRTHLNNSKFHSLSTAISMAAFGTPFINLKITNCRIFGHDNQGSDWSNRGRIVYPQPHINVLIEDSFLQGGGRTQFNHFSSSMDMDAVEAGTSQQADETIYIKNTRFKDVNDNGIGAVFTNNLGQLTIVENCVFDGVRGVEGRSPCYVINCKAVNKGGLFTPYSTNPRYPEFDKAVIQGGSADTPRLTASTIITEYTSSSSIGKNYNLTVSGVDFNGGTIGHQGDFKLNCTNCTFKTLDPDSTIKTTIIASSDIAFNNCSFLGQTQNFISTANSNAKISFNNCVFDQNAWGDINLNVQPSAGESVTVDDGINNVIFTFETNVDIGATIEETERNLIGAINASVLLCVAMPRNTGSLYLYNEEADRFNLGFISESSANITVQTFKASNSYGFGARSLNATGGGNVFLNCAEPRSGDQFGNLGLANGNTNTPKNSAATTYLEMNGDFTEITGSATITNLRFANSVDSHKLFGGQVVKLLSSGGFGINVGGNITPKTGALTVIPIGNILQLIYSKELDKWIEL